MLMYTTPLALLLPLMLQRACPPRALGQASVVHRCAPDARAGLAPARMGPSAGDTDRHLRDFVAGSLRIERVDAQSSAQCRAVAAVRCSAFSKGLSVDDTIARRFELMGVLRARAQKGAAVRACVCVCVCVCVCECVNV